LIYGSDILSLLLILVAHAIAEGALSRSPRRRSCRSSVPKSRKI